MKSRTLIIILVSILFLFYLLRITNWDSILSNIGLYLENDRDNKEDNLPLSIEKKQESSNNSEISLFFVGDIMLGRGVEYMINKEGKGDFRFPFLEIADELKKSDILFANLEGPISNKGIKVGSIYSFRFNPKAIEGLIYADFNILSLANNHMLDYQRIALEDTMNLLKENNIDYIGAGFNKKEAFSLKIKEIKDTEIGFLAYTNLGSENWKAGEKNSGMAWINEDDIGKVTEDIKKAKEKVDVLVISLHAGEEYKKNPTPFQISFAESCIENGADLVIGHHPHIIQEIKRYEDGWISYSLGNFIFDQGFSEETMKSIILKVTIEDKKIKTVSFENIKINEYFQPELVNGN